MVLQICRRSQWGSEQGAAAVANEAGNVVGVMPHPERGSDECSAPYDGRILLEGFLPRRWSRRDRPTPGRSDDERLGMTDEEHDSVLRALLGRGSAPGRTGHVFGDVVRALFVQVLPGPPAPVSHRSAVGCGWTRRERRRRRYRGWLAGRPSHREPQPPFVCRALSGSGHRGWGILRDIFTMGARPIALWDRSVSAPSTPRRIAICSKASSPGSLATETRSACPPSVGKSISIPATRQSPGQRDVSGHPPSRTARSRHRRAPGTVAVLLGRATGRDGIGGASVLASASFDDESQLSAPVSR